MLPSAGVNGSTDAAARTRPAISVTEPADVLRIIFLHAELHPGLIVLVFS
jgi:hypothetical protein